MTEIELLKKEIVNLEHALKHAKQKPNVTDEEIENIEKKISVKKATINRLENKYIYIFDF